MPSRSSACEGKRSSGPVEIEVAPGTQPGELRVLRGKPKPGTRLANLFRNMLVYSSNKAANELEVWLGGSTYAGAARVTATLPDATLFET